MVLYMRTTVEPPMARAKPCQLIMQSPAIGRIRGWAPQGTRLLFDQAFSWRTAMVGWGVFAGAIGLLVVERIPAFRRDFFSKLPIIGDRYAAYRVHEEDETE